MVKPRSRRRSFNQIVANRTATKQKLTQRDKRSIFLEWNRSFRNPSARRFNEAFWKHKVRKTKKPPSHTEFGVRSSQAKQMRQVVEDIVKR